MDKYLDSQAKRQQCYMVRIYYTYVRWPGATYKDDPIIPIWPGTEQMDNLDMDNWDLADILENGYECVESPRREGIFEKCMRIGGQEIKIVGKWVESHPLAEGEAAWLVWHVKPTGKGRK